MHYYQFNIGDYHSHTLHLSEIEDLTYRRLLDWYYLHESSIPLDLNEIARQIRMRSHSDCIATVLQEFFDRAKIEFLEDTKEVCYFPFTNGVVRVTKDGMKLMNYGEVGKVIWKSQVLDHKIYIEDDFKIDNCEYFKFLVESAGISECIN